MNSTFGRRLADLLKWRRMTQRDLAAATGLTEGTISRYVSGAREPKAIIAAKIAKALNVSPQELLDSPTDFEVDNAVRIVARNAKDLTEDQRTQLIAALAKR